MERNPTCIRKWVALGRWWLVSRKISAMGWQRMGYGVPTVHASWSPA